MRSELTREISDRRQYEIEVEGEVAVIDPTYMNDRLEPDMRDSLSFKVEATGVWKVRVESLDGVPDHRNGSLIATRKGSDPTDGEWKKGGEAAVDSGLMSFFPIERGFIEDLEVFFDELDNGNRDSGEITALTAAQGALCCSSGLGDGMYPVLTRRGGTGAIDGIKVDFTPSDVQRQLIYG